VVVFGAGAIGGVVGGMLHRHGHDVTFVARGENLQALQRGGLRLELPGETVRLPVHSVGSPEDVDWGTESGTADGAPTVLLTVKSQDTRGALDALAKSAPPQTPLVCAQNGVDNERATLRRFPRTYGMCVMCPATHLRPGVVQAHSSPVTGLLDLGRYPSGIDGTAAALSEALRGATFDSRALEDVMRWKRRKLLMNLSNAVEALCGPEARGSEIAKMATREGEDALRAAGAGFASREEDADRRGSLLTVQPTESGQWSGGSSWQSVTRGAGSIEADYLNGEIVLLGRLHGVPTPANALLQRLANEHVRSRPASSEQPAWTADLLMAALGSERGDV